MPYRIPSNFCAFFSDPAYGTPDPKGAQVWRCHSYYQLVCRATDKTDESAGECQAFHYGTCTQLILSRLFNESWSYCETWKLQQRQHWNFFRQICILLPCALISSWTALELITYAIVCVSCITEDVKFVIFLIKKKDCSGAGKIILNEFGFTLAFVIWFERE